MQDTLALLNKIVDAGFVVIIAVFVIAICLAIKRVSGSSGGVAEDGKR